MTDMDSTELRCVTLRRDLTELQGLLISVASRTGVHACPSWRYPDRPAWHLDLPVLLQQELEEQNQDGTREVTLLLELIVDRLVLLLLTVERFVSGASEWWRGGVAPPDRDVKGSSVSVSLAARWLWERLITSYGRQEAPEQDLQKGIKKDMGAQDATTQTGSWTGSLCSRCMSTQTGMRVVCDAVMKLCQSQQLPSCLSQLRRDVGQGPGHPTDTSRWAANMARDLTRVMRHMERLEGEVVPLKAELEQEKQQAADIAASLRNAKAELNFTVGRLQSDHERTVQAMDKERLEVIREDEEDLPPAVAVPTMEGVGEAAASDTPGVQDVVGAAGTPAPTGVEDGWRHVAVQLDSLRAVLLQLLTLVAPATMSDRLSGEPSSGAEPSAIGACATLPALSDTQHDAAILGVVRDERREAAILSPPPRQAAILLPSPREAAILPPPHGDAILSPPRGTPAAGNGDSGTRSHRLTTVKEFSIGGDWSAFACRFEVAVRSAKWTDAEALEVLPTLLDDESVRLFRSIKAAKKTMLKGVFEEMVEAYEPPDDAHRRFVQRQRAPEESPVAFRGAVLELAMAAYPDTEPDLLEPLILGKMLELSRDLGIPMPVCGHEQLTSRIAAKCLDVQFNLRWWKQVTPGREPQSRRWCHRVGSVQSRLRTGREGA
ncbi:coiled-coil domain-containing protein 157 isoform X1 [Lampetra fluviatilis]